MDALITGRHRICPSISGIRHALRIAIVGEEKRGFKKTTLRGNQIGCRIVIFQQNAGYTEELKAKPEHLKFLIGKNGANVKKIRDKTKARIIFPSEKDDDRESIVIIGRKEEVMQAKKELQDMIKELVRIF
ncbi:vigilin-like [Centruroides sculpturatus]|uniref:vigilin-like n=1 Tax=Centruroides sculpturatus TaxID=218467 RepID=UPI000C6E450A|nr:vigilin-like [Centruroides sculpturatus]